MKRVLKLFILLVIILIGKNVYALNIGETEELIFSSNYIKQATGNSDTIVFYDVDNVYYFDIEKNNLKTIYTSEIQISRVFVRGTTAYVYHGVKNDNSQGYIHEINALTGKEISNTNIKRTYKTGDNFVVDLKGNYYFEDNNIIDIYNKKGEKINSVTATKDIGSLNAFSPNDEYLFVDYSYYHEGILKLEDGELKSGEMFTKSYRMPEWKFASDKKTAVNQYGEVVVFDFTNFSKPYTLKAESVVPSRKYYSYPSFYETTDNLYISNNEGYIIGVNKTDYKKKDKYFIKENCYVIATKYANNSLYVLYKVDNKHYTTRIDLSKSKINPKNTVLNNHTPLSHTKSDIKTKYKAAEPTADYTNHYKEEPSKVAPYYEGVLKDDVVNDTLNQLNYYRYLAGLNSVTLNESKQARSQKGALIQAVNKTLTHTPSKPADMDDDFYKEAYAGCYASYAEGDTYSGNVSYNTRIDKAPGGFIDDNNNASGGVGHRNSMLDPFAKQVSFGSVQPYIAMSIYYDDINPNKDLFYAWPPAGNFPAENMYQKELTMWSIWLDKSIKVQSDSIITLTYKNKEYVIPKNWTIFDNYENVIAYYFPPDIRKEVVGGTGRFINGETVHVNISNLSDKDINTYEIDYDVNFFNVEEIELESVDIVTYEEGSSTGSVISPNRTANISVGKTYEISTRTYPANATIGRYSFKIDDNNIASLNGNKITPAYGGTTTLTVTDSYSNKSFKYTIKIYEQPEKVYFKDSEIKIKKGERYTLSPIIEPSTATVENGRYTSSDTSIAYISNGQVVGVKEGTVTITYKDTYHLDAPVATLTVKVLKEDDIPVTNLTFGNTSMSLEIGQTSSINAIITPSNATNKTITWTSSNTSVATVTNGKVTGLKAGEATITGKTNNGKTATCKVIVSEKVIPVTGLNIDKMDLSLQVGDSETLKATITPSNATVKTPVWTSKDTKVATVDQNGKVTGVKVGNTELVASAGGISVIIKVKVTEKETAITGISLNKTSTTIEVGNSETLSTTITPSNATNKNVTWTSSNTKVATVDNNGKVNGLSRGEVTITVRTNNNKTATCKVTVKEKKKEYKVSYTTHVQNIGWQDYIGDGEMAGTSGRSLRLEGIKIKLENQEYDGDIEYRTQVQDIGWQDFVKNDAMSGTSGQSKRLEAIEIRLTGEISNHYDIYYRVHAQDVGWMTWAKNGERSGTEGYGRRLEGIEIILVEKGQNPPERTDIRTNKKFVRKTVTYRTHVQNYGWQASVADGAMSGTSHESKRLEGIEISLYKPESGSGIEYRTHVQDYGWQDFVSNGTMSGTSGESKRLEAIEIRLTGPIAETHDVYYRVHAENFGWMGWAKNGESAGTAHYSYRLEGIEIVVLEKGEEPPIRTDTRTPQAFIDKNAWL